MNAAKLLEPWRYARRAALLLLRLADPLLQRIERGMVRSRLATGARHAPIFLIGAPRSGSTLLCKVLVDRWQLAYISNFSAYFFRTLCLGTWLGQRLGYGATEAGYEIRYGNLKGWAAPNEGGPFWYRWFPSGEHVYVGPREAADRALQELRDEVHAASAVAGAPMLFKNLYNSMRIAALVEAFPEASFIVCERDALQNALSLLRGRAELQGSKERWFSLPPREIEALRARPYAEQVAGQVHCINRQIAEDARRVGPERFLFVRYEAFCGDVHGSLARIEAFLRGRGHALAPRPTPIPARFDVREVTGIEPTDYDRVRAAVTTFAET